MEQDLKCAVCAAEERGCTLSELGIEGATAQWDAHAVHDAHLAKEKRG